MNIKNKIITGITATTILTSVGISAIPQERFYKDIPLPIETSQGLKTRISYNSVTVPTRANLKMSESWLLGDKRLEVKPTEFQTTFVGAWMNYMEDGEWKDIDSNFRRKGNSFVMDNAPFEVVVPLTSTGVATFLNNNVYNLADKEVFDEPTLTQTIQALGVAEVQGELETGDLGFGEATYVIYRQAYPDYDADLIYFVHEGTAPRLKKLIRFNSLEKAPSIDTEFDFKISYDSPVYIQREVGNKMIGWTRKSDIENYKGTFNVKVIGSRFVNDDSKIRGNAMKAFKIWDSGEREDKKSELINVNLSYLEEDDFILTKIIPADFFTDAVFPVYTDTTTDFYPDATTGTPTTVDGTLSYYDGVGRTWATQRGIAAANEVDDTDNNDWPVLFTSYSTTDKWERIRRAVFLFDTSDLTADVTISGATFSFYGTGKLDTGGMGIDMNVYSSNPASNDELVGGDYDSLGTTAFSTAITYANYSTNSYNVFTLNGDADPSRTLGLAAISKTGISKFGTRDATHDVGGTEPSWTASKSASVQGNMADNATNKPKLSVTYTVPSTRRILKMNQ